MARAKMLLVEDDAALAELLRRYLTSHGPATLRDFAWWTKLPITKIRRAFATIADEFVGDDSDEGRYWRQTLDDEVDAAGDAAEGLFLLPGFDEIVLGYPDRLLPFRMPSLELSSTAIRARVRAGRTVRHLVPAGVEARIDRLGLYRGGSTA